AVDLRDEVATRLGFTESDVARQLASGFEGSPVSTFWEGRRKIDIVARLDERETSRFDDVLSTYVRSSSTGARVPVRQVADIRAEWQSSRIVRRNGVRTITIGTFTHSGVLPSQVLAVVQPRVAALAMPRDIRVEYGGELEAQNESATQMTGALVAGLLGIFMILLFQFRNVKYALLIMVSIPLALFGTVLGLLITQNPFGFTAQLGMIALTGIVVRNAIILVDFINERRAHGEALEEAALDAGRRRLRPIFLTTMAAAVGVLPMILSGSTMWSPL